MHGGRLYARCVTMVRVYLMFHTLYSVCDLGYLALIRLRSATAISLALICIIDPRAVYSVCCARCNRTVSSASHWVPRWKSSGLMIIIVCVPRTSSMSCLFHRPFQMSPAISVSSHMWASAKSTKSLTHRCVCGRL